MKRILFLFLPLMAGVILMSCNQSEKTTTKNEDFKYVTEQFADLKIQRYKVPGFETLPLKTKTLLYYLSQAALSGRDIIYDQNCKYNLAVRRTLEAIVQTCTLPKDTPEWKDFMVYTKRVWFSNGIHHHYSSQKFEPGFTKDYFEKLVKNSDPKAFPVPDGKTIEDLVAILEPVMFDPEVMPVRVNQDPEADLIKTSAMNYYDGITQEEVEAYYKKVIDPNDDTPVMYGMNSRLVKEDGKIVEKVWKVGGLYTEAIEKVVYWLEKAIPFAESEQQKKTLELLVDYYKTGNLETFDEYSIEWVKDTESNVDMINGFIESYGDPLGYRSSYESIISVRDEEATKRCTAVSKNAKWFEDNSPIMDEHKREEVTGVSAKVITVVMESGDASPSTPIGVNLPNSNWIRANHGSKSVTLDNIVHSYNMAYQVSGIVEEFFLGEERIKRQKEFGPLADDLHTDLHEVIGHGSGKINPGVGTPKETLKQYASVLEESRADLVALYYLMDPKLVEIGVMPSLETGKAAYDDYITNGLMRQLARIILGDDIQQAHMRNRQLISKWAMEKGADKNVIEKVVENGKTYFVVNDFDALRTIFGEMLREVQRIKSEGDFEAGKNLVETYGVKIDRDLHAEVLERYGKLNIAPYAGFINPKLVAVEEDGEIVDVKIEYPDDFTTQMLEYANTYSFLPTYNN